jgi:hypothetical protein
MHRFERAIRKLIPSTPILSRSSWFYPLSRGIDLTVGAAARHLIGGIIPPVRYIVRTGTNNNIITPQISFMLHGYNYWLHKFAGGISGSLIDYAAATQFQQRNGHSHLVDGSFWPRQFLGKSSSIVKLFTGHYTILRVNNPAPSVHPACSGVPSS